MLSTNDLESIRQQLDTSQIKSWQSILVLIVFLLTSEFPQYILSSQETPNH